MHRGNGMICRDKAACRALLLFERPHITSLLSLLRVAFEKPVYPTSKGQALPLPVGAAPQRGRSSDLLLRHLATPLQPLKYGSAKPAGLCGSSANHETFGSLVKEGSRALRVSKD
jgi:hypothetical protein